MSKLFMNIIQENIIQENIIQENIIQENLSLERILENIDNNKINKKSIKIGSIKDLIYEYELVECIICYENIKCNNYCRLNCGHYFCNPCIKNQIESNGNIYCALCRRKIKIIYTNNYNFTIN